jgi:hypothetical protein
VEPARSHPESPAKTEVPDDVARVGQTGAQHCRGDRRRSRVSCPPRYPWGPSCNVVARTTVYARGGWSSVNRPRGASAGRVTPVERDDGARPMRRPGRSGPWRRANISLSMDEDNRRTPLAGAPARGADPSLMEWATAGRTAASRRETTRRMPARR